MLAAKGAASRRGDGDLRVEPQEVVRVRRMAKPSSEHFAEMDDATLLSWVIEGSEPGWAAFYRRFRGLILSCAAKTSSKCGVRLGPEELKDVLSEVAVNLVSHERRRLKLYRSDRGSSVATWVGVIAVSTTRDYLRRARRQQHELFSEQELDLMASTMPGPEDQILDHERRSAAGKLLSQLSDRDRHFVELYFGAALTPEEIAEEMKISLSTVYSKKAKIKTRLSELIREAQGQSVR